MGGRGGRERAGLQLGPSASPLSADLQTRACSAGRCVGPTRGRMTMTVVDLFWCRRLYVPSYSTPEDTSCRGDRLLAARAEDSRGLISRRLAPVRFLRSPAALASAGAGQST